MPAAASKVSEKCCWIPILVVMVAKLAVSALSKNTKRTLKARKRCMIFKQASGQGGWEHGDPVLSETNVILKRG